MISKCTDTQNALILNGTDAFESKMGLNSNNKCG